MNRKGAIGLSINMLVVIIISIVILGSGLTLMYKFIDGANSLKGDLDSQTKDELNRLLVGQGRQFALPLNSKVVSAGDQHVFGVGLLNIERGQDFFITVELSKFAGDDGSDESSLIKEEIENWVLFNTGDIFLEENEAHNEALLVSVDPAADKGQYIFNVRAFKLETEDQYGRTQKFTVTVP